MFVSPAVEGTMHDKKLAETMELSFPATTRVLQDSGFQGLDIQA
ncbi:MAG: hypothetical protein ACKOEV_11310 [Cytophagales bacterium]